jgi:hypothetical protein
MPDQSQNSPDSGKFFGTSTGKFRIRMMKGNKHMKTIITIIESTFAVFSLACSALAQQTPDRVSIRVITTFDYPGTGIVSTGGQKINDSNDIVGTYIDSNGAYGGFVRFANGNFSAPIVDPNDTCSLTLGRGINNSRLVCGEYYVGDCTNSYGYFLMGRHFRDFDIPGSISTAVLGVNNAGDFAGGFTDGTGFNQAFVSISGTITPISVPGAIFTTAYQLNSSNQTEGYYDDGSGTLHGFWRDANGTLHFPIDPPGSTLTVLFGNNDTNWMVGRCVDSAGTHGLFFVPPNRFFSFDYPGSSFTSFSGINAQGFICGRYRDVSGIEHGIVARVRVSASANETGTEMNASDSPSLVTPLNPPSLVRPVKTPPSPGRDKVPAL